MIFSYSNGAGKTVSVNEKTRITVPEDRYGLYAIDTLDPDMVRHYSLHLFVVVLLSYLCKFHTKQSQLVEVYVVR